MNTTNPKKPEAAANKSSKTKDANQDASQSAEALQQLMGIFAPLIEFHKADETMTADDVKMFWDVRLVRGRDEPFAHLQGSSTFHKMLASNMCIEATSAIQQEIKDKIVMPLTAKLQEEVERLTCPTLDMRKVATDDDDDEDEYPCSDNPPMP